MLISPLETPRIAEIETKFVELFGMKPTILVRAPGRVNLIGELLLDFVGDDDELFELR